MATQTAILNVKINVDGKDTVIPVQNLKQLKDAVKSINEQRITLAPDSAGFAQATQQVNTLNKLYRDLSKGAGDATTAIKSANDELSGVSKSVGYYRQLQQQLTALTNQYKDLNKAQLEGSKGKALQGQIRGVSDTLKQLDAGIGNYQRNVGNYGSALSGLFGGVRTAIGGASALVAGIAGNTIVQTTAQFEKLITVLTQNAGGNKLDALKQFEVIRQFAADTPFQVDELTESFKNLQNRGVRPTSLTLEKLGDFAANEGRSIDQVTQAVLDVTSGQTRRLEEIGVQAALSGDKIKFFYKGVAGEVDKTADGVNKIIDALYSAKGVAGSMAAQSKTLGGAISNAGDAFDRLFFAIGNSSGAIKDTVVGFSNLVNSIAQLIETPLSEQLAKDQLQFEGLVGALQQGNIDADVRNRLQAQLIAQYPEYIQYTDKDKQTQIDLSATLEIGNKLFERRIFLQAQEEQLTKFANDKIKLIEQEVEARQKAARLQEQIAQSQKSNNALEVVTNDIANAVRGNSRSAAERDIKIYEQQREKLDADQKAFLEQQQRIEGQFFKDPTANTAEKLRLQLEAKKKADADAAAKKAAADAAKLFGKLTAEEKKALKETEKIEKEKARLRRAALFAPGSGQTDNAVPPIVEDQQVVNFVSAFDIGLENLTADFQNNIDDQIAFFETRLEALKQTASQLGDNTPPEFTARLNAEERSLNALKERRELEKKFDEERAKADEESYKQQQERSKQSIEDEIERRKTIKEAAIEAAGEISGAVFSIAKSNIEKEADEKQRALDKEYETKIAAAQGNAQIEAALRAELEAKKAQLEKDAANRRKKIAITEAVIEGALSAIKASANPLQLGLVALTTAANIAIISAQQFAKGGFVKRQKAGWIAPSDANAPATPSGDTVLAYMKPGELVMNQQQQHALSNIAGPDIYKRIGVPGAKAYPRQPQQTRVSVNNELSLSDGQVGSFARVVGRNTATAVSTSVRSELNKDRALRNRDARISQFKAKKNR